MVTVLASQRALQPPAGGVLQRIERVCKSVARANPGMTMRMIECPECDWLSPEERAQLLPFLAAALGERGTRVAGDLEVLKQSGISLLLRGRDSNGAAFYLKAVPPTFRQEPALTAALGARFSASLPVVLATDADRRILITREVPGSLLREQADPAGWLATAETLAQIQLGSASERAAWLACACPERALHALDGEVELILSEAAPRCAEVGAPIPHELLSRLDALRETLSAEASELASHAVPQTLVHGDFHAGNVIVAAGGAPTIIDWSDGALAHPFFDPFILFHAGRMPLEGALRDAMLDTYLSAWHRAGFGSLRELQLAFELAQRLAPLYHAASYRRVVAIGRNAARDFARAFVWLLGLLSQAHA